MVKVVLLLGLISLAVFVGIVVHGDPGYMLIAIHNYEIEAPLWLAALALLLLATMAYVGLRFLHNLFSVGDVIVQYHERHQLQNARERTNKGLIELAEGHWARAEKLLLKGAINSESPLVNYLSLARAAGEQGEHQRRDKYLRMAHEATRGTDIAVGLTQAQLQLSHGQLEQSLATLKHLRSLAPKHSFVLKLLKDVYLRLKDWEHLQGILPALRKAQVLSQDEETALLAQLFVERLRAAYQQGTLQALMAIWSEVPKTLQAEEAIVLVYCEALNHFDEGIEAETVLRQALRKTWTDSLVHLYGRVRGANLAKQLAQAEAWLRVHDKDPVLLLSLGRISLMSQLWGKAQRYFEASIVLLPMAETYAELAQLFTELNKPEESAACYRKGLLLATPQHTQNIESAGKMLATGALARVESN